MRLLLSLATMHLCVGLVVFWQPSLAVPGVALGLVVAGFIADEERSGRQERRASARRVAMVHAAVVTCLWAAWASHLPFRQRLLVAPVLGVGLGLAAGALVLIGLDGRRHVRGMD